MKYPSHHDGFLSKVGEYLWKRALINSYMDLNVEGITPDIIELLQINWSSNSW